MKIRIISFGKIKDASVGELIDYYTKLTERYVTVEQISLKDTSSELITYDQIKDQIDGFTVILTENGKDYTSRGFSTFLYKKFVDFGTVTFIIGNAFGFELEVVSGVNSTLSLSKLTFPHEIAHMLLVEQLYRAMNIQSGGKYHK